MNAEPNDDRLDALLRAAQPHQATIDLGDLQAAGHHLLEGIMAAPIEPPVDELSETGLTATTSEPVRAAAPGRRRPLVLLAAAAAVVAAVALPTWWVGRDQPVTVVPGAGEAGDHIVVDLPGWKVTGMSSRQDSESIQYGQGDESVEINRAPAKYYQGYRDDRDAGGMDTRKAAALGQEGTLYVYGEDDRYELMVPPARGTFMYIDVYAKDDRVDEILGALTYADDSTWEAQVPDDFVTASNAGTMTKQMLADIPLPTGLTAKQLAKGYDQDYYQFTAHVTGQVACGWIADWAQAKQDGDADEVQKAVDALATSHDWKALQKIQSQGGWSDVLWELADAVKDGGDVPGGKPGLTVQDTYKDALGCQ